MDICAYESVGELRFGLTRKEIHTLLGSGFEQFYKGRFSAIATDAYDDLGLHLYYDQDDRLEFIEAWGPTIITFNGIELFGRVPKLVDADMRALGHVPVRTDVGLQYDSAGIALTVENGIVSGVAAFCRGYYDHQKETTKELLEKYRQTHTVHQPPPQRLVSEPPAAEMRYCWRCHEEVPMLNEAADAEIQALWNNAIEATGRREASSMDFDDDDAEPPEMEAVYQRYRELTGQEWRMRHLAPYHKLSDLGPPCIQCGKPLRTNKATTCLECGQKQK